MSVNDALRATVTTTPDSGVVVSTTGVTIAPADYPLVIQAGQSWAFYLGWNREGQPVDTSAGTPTFTMAAVAGTVVVTGTGGAAYMAFARTPTQSAALPFVRAAYTLDYSEGGTVTRLLASVVDVER